MSDCWESGGPEWLFGVVLGGPILGLLLAVLWLFTIALGMPVARPADRLAKIPRLVFQLVMIAGTAFIGFAGLAGAPDAGRTGFQAGIILALAIAACAVPLAIMSRKISSLSWSELRRIPLAVLAPLPILAVAAMASGIAASGAMVVLGHSC